MGLTPSQLMPHLQQDVILLTAGPRVTLIKWEPGMTVEPSKRS